MLLLLVLLACFISTLKMVLFNLSSIFWNLWITSVASIVCSSVYPSNVWGSDLVSIIQMQEDRMQNRIKRLLRNYNYLKIKFPVMSLLCLLFWRGWKSAFLRLTNWILTTESYILHLRGKRLVDQISAFWRYFCISWWFED